MNKNFYGNTNALINIENNSSGGDLVYANNNTGQEIQINQKVWLNRRDVMPIEQNTFTSGGNYSLMGGRFIFTDINNNFIGVVSNGNGYFKGTFDNQTRSWNLVNNIEFNNNNIIAISYNYNKFSNKYYGYPYNNSNTIYQPTETKCIIYNNDETFTTYTDRVKLAENISLRIATRYIYDIYDDTNDSLIKSVDLSTNKEKATSILCEQIEENKYKILIITTNTSDVVREHWIDLEKTATHGWISSVNLEEVINNQLVQTTIKYYTGLQEGDYLFTNLIINNNSNRLYNLEVYKIENGKIVKALEYNSDIYKYESTPCTCRYDARQKRLYITTQTTYEMFSFDENSKTFNKIDIVFDTSGIITLYEYGFSFYVSDDLTTIYLQGETNASSGKVFVVIIPNTQEKNWFADTFAMCSLNSLTGFATGNKNSSDQYEILTILPKE